MRGKRNGEGEKKKTVAEIRRAKNKIYNFLTGTSSRKAESQVTVSLSVSKHTKQGSSYSEKSYTEVLLWMAYSHVSSCFNLQEFYRALFPICKKYSESWKNQLGQNTQQVSELGFKSTLLLQAVSL
jgi:hypothetical protein